MDEKTGSKIVFDIVNSVKGGSGKSTVALQLAAYWAFQHDTDAYIIDLDLRGTSWKTSYEEYFLQTDRACKTYINSLMYDFVEDSVFRHLNVKGNSSVPRTSVGADVRLCIGNPDATGDIDAVKVDLLESTVYDIIKHALAKSHGREEIHIIFDMPPSYESHAERVVKHLLMDKESNLFKDYYKGKGCAYHVNLFMIYAITGAHVEQNLIYIRNFFKQSAYSSEIGTLIEENNFSLYFIGNDVSGALDTNPASKPNILEKIESLLNSKGKPVLPEVSGPLKGNLTENLKVITHMAGLGPRNLKYFLGTEPEQAELQLMSEASEVFKEIFHPEKSNP